MPELDVTERFAAACVAVSERDAVAYDEAMLDLVSIWTRHGSGRLPAVKALDAAPCRHDRNAEEYEQR